jgi:signal peptidase I
MRQLSETADVPEAPESADTPNASESSETRQQKLTVLRFLLKLAVTLLVLWVIFAFVFGIRQVSGEAMYPRLRDGDLILFYRLESDYQIDDVVTFRQDGMTYYGRIVAQGGDVVQIDESGQLSVNGNVQQEEIFYETEPQNGDVTYPYTVEADSYFILCDYRTVGTDSRSYGAVARNELDGKIITLLRRRGV